MCDHAHLAVYLRGAQKEGEEARQHTTPLPTKMLSPQNLNRKTYVKPAKELSFVPASLGSRALPACSYVSSLGFQEKMWSVLRAFFAGLYDVLSPLQLLIFILSSRKIRTRCIQCFFLNGIIFLGSLLLVEKGFAPLIRSLLVDSPNTNPTLAVVGDKVSLTFFWAYYVSSLRGRVCMCCDWACAQ